MRKAVVLDAGDVKEILAKYFGVKAENVIKSQYSYTVITDDDDEKSESGLLTED